MDATDQRAAGFVFPGEEPEQLTQAATSALATVPQLTALVQQQQSQIANLNQIVTQQQQQANALMMQAHQLLTQAKLPVLHTTMHKMVERVPGEFITQGSHVRKLDADGSFEEVITFEANPRQFFEGMAAKIRAEADYNYSRSLAGRVFGKRY